MRILSEKIHMKQCTKCKEWKEPTEFFKDKGQKSGLRPDCKVCNQKQSSERAKKNRKQLNFNNLKYVTGVSKETYEDVLSEQNSVCAICGRPNVNPKRNLSVDHCHESGFVRGLLCTKCNFGLGYFDDNPEILRNAIDYLSNNISHRGIKCKKYKPPKKKKEYENSAR
jgi:hypothetical protein